MRWLYYLAVLFLSYKGTKVKLPQFLKKQQSSAESIANMEGFVCNALQVKEQLRQGTFGDMYTTEYGTEGNVKAVVVKKRF